VDRNTAVWVLVVVIAAGMTLAALSSSSSFNREVAEQRRAQEAQAVAIAAAATAGPAPAPAKEPPPAPEALPPLPKKAAPPPEPGGSVAPPDRLPRLEAVGRRLVLSPELRDRVGAIADRTKKEIFDLFWVPRADGGCLAVDLLKAREAGDDGAEQLILDRLPFLHVPGTRLSYGQAVRLSRAQGFGSLFEALGAAAYVRFKELNLNPDEIDTGFDPWAAHAKSGK
jgi:hypothetical protein